MHCFGPIRRRAISAEPKGMIERRMVETLRKLSRMQGRHFYFVSTAGTARRARTNSRKAGWGIMSFSLLRNPQAV